MTKFFPKIIMIFMMTMLIIPMEAKSILESVRNVNAKRKIISIFEPHRYSRALSLKKNFQNHL